MFVSVTICLKASLSFLVVSLGDGKAHKSKMVNTYGIQEHRFSL